MVIHRYKPSTVSRSANARHTSSIPGDSLGQQSWGASFRPHVGSPLGPGTYQHYTGPSVDDRNPGPTMSVSGEGGGCGETGSFVVTRPHSRPWMGASPASIPASDSGVRVPRSGFVSGFATVHRATFARPCHLTASGSDGLVAQRSCHGATRRPPTLPARACAGTPEGGAAGEPTVGHSAYIGGDTSTAVPGLRSGRRYTFTLRSWDRAGNVSAPRKISAITP